MPARSQIVLCTCRIFFGGEGYSAEDLAASRWEKIDLKGFEERNNKEIRFPTILACARALKEEKKHERIGAIGFCFGGWAVFQLGSAEHNPSGQTPLVDAISTGHPTWLTQEEIDDVAVPVQILAPEIDPVFNAELKAHALKMIPTKGVPFQYSFFPRVSHAFCTRGLEEDKVAMERAKDEAVAWFRQWLRTE